MSKYTQKRIEEITTLTTIDIPNAIKNGIGLDEYFSKYRITLNLTLIQALIGCEFVAPKKKDGDYKVKCNHKLPDMDEISKIASIMNNYVTTVEEPFLKENAFDTIDDEDDDISLPPVPVSSIPELEKINQKKINEYIFGDVGLSRMVITGMDVIELAAVGRKIKKVKNRNMMLLIGGIALLLAGGGIAAACIANSKKDNDDIVDPDNIDIDPDNIDIDPDNIGEDDIPSVEFDDAV